QQIRNYAHIADWRAKYSVLINTEEDQCKDEPDEAISPLNSLARPASRRESDQCSLHDSNHQRIDDDISDLSDRIDDIGWSVRCLQCFLKQEEDSRRKYCQNKDTYHKVGENDEQPVEYPPWLAEQIIGEIEKTQQRKEVTKKSNAVQDMLREEVLKVRSDRCLCYSIHLASP